MKKTLIREFKYNFLMYFYRLLDFLFDYEIMIRPGGNPYLYRWTLKRFKNSAWYLHNFVGSDWAEALHDHPKKFMSIGIKGSYFEEGEEGELKRYKAPWFRTFPAEFKHRIILPKGNSAWTLVRAGKVEREWGFWPDGKFVLWQDYLRDYKYKEEK